MCRNGDVELRDSRVNSKDVRRRKKNIKRIFTIVRPAAIPHQVDNKVGIIIHSQTRVL